MDMIKIIIIHKFKKQNMDMIKIIINILYHSFA
jgi:hypothetical protein